MTLTVLIIAFLLCLLGECGKLVFLFLDDVIFIQDVFEKQILIFGRQLKLRLALGRLGLRLHTRAPDAKPGAPMGPSPADVAIAGLGHRWRRCRRISTGTVHLGHVLQMVVS